MHNFNVLHNDLQFKACNHAYRMQFNANTTIKDRDFPDIPQCEYEFKKFGDILAENFQTDLLVDIVGAVEKMIFSQTQTTLKKVILNLRDSSGKTMVMILTHARVKEGRGKYPPSLRNSWCGSKLLIDDEIPDYEKYQER
ncbi:hypothetical protein Lalb_Chr11g0072791 [Lupinus albus]|uniref:DUF223 domain-containing protein n=1 Tax=Lupinus albus TaxID=3870 RepID=A0A6A4PSK5_LUPAL|nr:hypothetical protein Lalb_Chr11g0072791 [Lupinus albus]